MNYTMVAEKVDPEDWATPSTNELVKRALNPIYKGEEILFFSMMREESYTYSRGAPNHY